jgi:hypothetical protein
MSEITFLNIDLDIESIDDISPLVNEWGDRVSVQRLEKIEGTYIGSFETGYGSVPEILDEYVSLITNLSETSKSIWDSALKKEFDFGFECSTWPSNIHVSVDSRFISKLSQVGGSVAVTVYPASNS